VSFFVSCTMKDRTEYLKAYRQANKEKIKAQQKAYNKERYERMKETAPKRDNKESNKRTYERNKARQLEIYAQNPSLRPVFVERYQPESQATEPQ
jgi:hypothetical protein